MTEQKNKPLPLLKFPDLVRRKMWCAMEPCDAFMASYCSKRTKNDVRDAWRVRDCHVGNVVEIASNKASFFFSENQKRSHIVRFDQVYPVSRRQITLLPGLTLPYDFHIDCICCHVKNFKTDVPFQEIHEKICDVFGVVRDAVMISDPAIGKFWPSSRISKSRLMPMFTNVDLNNFFTASPNHELSIIYAFDAIRPPLKENKLHDVHNLMVYIPRTFAGSIIANFRGKNLVLWKAKLEKFNIRSFFHKLMRKERMNVESIIVFMEKPEIGFSVESTLESWGQYLTEKPSGSKLEYQYKSELRNYHELPLGTFNCSGAHFFRSKFGELACVKLSMEYFMVFAWNNKQTIAERP